VLCHRATDSDVDSQGGDLFLEKEMSERDKGQAQASSRNVSQLDNDNRQRQPTLKPIELKTLRDREVVSQT
jgi:DNA-binding transcriptional regulator YiaG